MSLVLIHPAPDEGWADMRLAGVLSHALAGHQVRVIRRAEELNDLFDSARRQEVDFSGLITFHDGFRYFAEAFDLPLLASIEEEAGSEASAKEIVEITDLVKEKGIPVIFTEVNGSDATAQAIRRETGCAVEQLTMIMDGPDDQLENYYDALLANAKAVINGFAGEELFF